jgi:hypothetical protein
MSATLKIRKPVRPLSEIVDQLGDVKAQIADLKAKETALRDELADSGESEVEGDLFRATVSKFEVDRTDWKCVVSSQKMTPTLSRLINSNTTKTEQTTVKIVAR